MKKAYVWGGIIAAVILFLFIGGCASYNGLVEQEQTVDAAWGNVENQYQRRMDLIPNLVQTVKGYASHESQTLQGVTDARAGLQSAYDAASRLPRGTEAQADIDNYQQAQSRLKGALDIYVNAVHEAYPDLKANQNFLDLQAQLEGTENRVSTERTRYNEAVKQYNTNVLRFPGRLFAGMFGFEKRDMFRAEEGAQRAPKVEF